MGTFLTVLTIIVCLLLIAVVLIQNSRGGGLAISGAGSQLMGVQKTTDFLERTTWTLAILLIVLALSSKFGTSPDGGPDGNQGESELKEKVENTPVVTPITQPSAQPAPAPDKSAPSK